MILVCFSRPEYDESGREYPGDYFQKTYSSLEEAQSGIDSIVHPVVAPFEKCYFEWAREDENGVPGRMFNIQWHSKLALREA